ncbi:hypothetical protein BZG36_04992 [Bifiguratus adelaidae]|uniref:Uncharacterized protein n=1 Tax=Bifiguratus adelaidae TaxID=1938954 RepID=A0A261XUE1_9FUNG|nr:hypothetical protein BZG36_04992 [Bifiguratus adelaidae]
MRFVCLTSLVLLVSLTIQAAVPPSSSIDAALDINDLSTLNRLVQVKATIDPRVIEQVILAKKIQRVLEEEATGTESRAYQDKLNKDMIAHLLRDERMYKVIQALIENKSVQDRMQGILLVPYTVKSPIGEISHENVARWSNQVRDTSVSPLSPEEQAMIERGFARDVSETNPRKRDAEDTQEEEQDVSVEDVENLRHMGFFGMRRFGRFGRFGHGFGFRGLRFRRFPFGGLGFHRFGFWRGSRWRGMGHHPGWGLWSDDDVVPMSELDELEAKLGKGESVQGSSELAILLDEMKQVKEASEKEPDIQLSQTAIETPFFCEADSISQYSRVCSTYFDISATA